MSKREEVVRYLKGSFLKKDLVQISVSQYMAMFCHLAGVSGDSIDVDRIIGRLVEEASSEDFLRDFIDRLEADASEEDLRQANEFMESDASKNLSKAGNMLSDYNNKLYRLCIAEGLKEDLRIRNNGSPIPLNA